MPLISIRLFDLKSVIYYQGKELLTEQSKAITLIDLRDQIDAVDKQIHSLLNKRAGLAKQVADIKTLEAQQNGSNDIVFYRPEREAAVLRKLMERNEGPLSNEEAARLFREIMSACLALEQPLKIAFLGPEGTFTQAAALKHFGHSVKTIPFSSIDQVFREVDAEACNYGVVPIENSTEGVINYTLDLFIDSPLKIVGEVSLRIHHHLMSKANSLQEIDKVYSHQQSLAQCRDWLDTKMSCIKRIDVESNAEAARLAENDPKAAAIASSAAAEIYNLDILEANIEDSPDNTTRFLILGKQDVEPSNTATEKDPAAFDKTSLLVSSANKPGALYSLLTPLANNGISMTRIESRPAQSGVWQYVFFIDIEGHAAEPLVSKAIDEIKSEATLVKILGSYPKAVL